MLRSTMLAILLVSPLAGNAQAKNWISAMFSPPSTLHHTAGPALVPDSQPELAGSAAYSDMQPMPVSHSYGNHTYSGSGEGYGDQGCSSCGSNYSDLWAGYCSKKHHHWFGGHHKKCCGHKGCGHKCHRHKGCGHKCHGHKGCGMSHFKEKCHSCWGHLSHWFHKGCGCSSCSTGCSDCESHEAEHYEGEIVPTPMEDASPSDRAQVNRSASIKLLPPSLRLWPTGFGL